MTILSWYFNIVILQIKNKQTNKKTGAQKDTVTFPKSQSYSITGVGIEPEQNMIAHTLIHDAIKNVL